MMKFVVLAFALFSAVAQARIPFAPADNANKDASFEQFRTELRQIVAAKDHKALLARVHQNISYSYGERPGIDGFIRAWDLTDAKAATSPIWSELEAVLNLGGTFSRNGEFMAPYTYSRWPRNLDPYKWTAAITVGANVRMQPTVNSPIVYVASHEILRLYGYPMPGQHWIAVVTPQGYLGYIHHSLVRSPVDYRAHFRLNKKGEWKMSVFIGGD